MYCVKMKRFFFTLLFLMSSSHIFGHQPLSLEQAITIAHKQSSHVQVVQLSFMTRYWNYRSYKAQLFPSFNLNGTVGNYNRSLVQIQNYDTGEIKYFRNNILSNSLGASLKQNIPFTGGELSLSTNLLRLDQFTNNTITYNSTPLIISYIQPLRAYNELKWQKQTSPREYEKAKRNLLESTENITITVVNFYFEALKNQINYEKALLSAKDNERLYAIAQQRFEIGAIAKGELLQLELAMHQSNLAVNDCRILFDESINNLCTYIGIKETELIVLVSPTNIPNIKLDNEYVLDLAVRNSSFTIEHELKMLNAAQNVAKAKSQRGVQATFSANLGLSQATNKLIAAYRDLRDQEVISVTLSMPIFDWGMSRGRVKMAQAQQRLIQTEVRQEEVSFTKDIQLKVLRFNNQAEQCEISHKAMEVANERYKIIYQQFENGSITVTELNNAQHEQKNASSQYVTQLGILWNSYFEIRRLTLFDFISNKSLSTEFDKIIK